MRRRRSAPKRGAPQPIRSDDVPEFAADAIQRWLKQLGVDDYTRKTTAVEARHASPEDLDLLALSPGAIVLLTRSVDIDVDARPVLYGESRFAADRVELFIDNGGPAGAAPSP